MAFGFSKSFVIFLFIAIIVGIGTKSWQNGLGVIIFFAVIRIIWKMLT